MLPCVSSVIDHRWRQNVVKTMKWHTSCRQVCHWCFYHILTSSVIYYWTDPRQHGIYLFYTMIRKEKDRYTYLPRTAWLLEDLCYLGIFLSPKRYFSLCFSFFSFVLIVYSFFEKFFNVFFCSKQNNGENILQNGESLIAMKHDGSCCEDFL